MVERDEEEILQTRIGVMKRAKNKDDVLAYAHVQQGERGPTAIWVHVFSRTDRRHAVAATGRKNRFILFSLHFPLCFKYDLSICNALCEVSFSRCFVRDTSDFEAQVRNKAQGSHRIRAQSVCSLLPPLLVITARVICL
jgi:hypothetical protein